MAMSFTRPDPSSPASVADANFSTGRRGYDQTEVRDFLRMVAAELGRLQERERFLERELRTAQANPDLESVEFDDQTLTRLLGEETARVLTTARESAAEIRGKAEQSASQLLTEASDEAARVREEAEVEASRRRADAGADAEAELSMAKQQGREMVNEARAYRERVLSELARRRELAREQIEQLLHGRDRLMQSFERARLVAVDVVAELQPLGEPDEYVNLTPTTGPVPMMVKGAPRPDAGGPPTQPVAAVPAEGRAQTSRDEQVADDVADIDAGDDADVTDADSEQGDGVANAGAATQVGDEVAHATPLRSVDVDEVTEEQDSDTAQHADNVAEVDGSDSADAAGEPGGSAASGTVTADDSGVATGEGDAPGDAGSDDDAAAAGSNTDDAGSNAEDAVATAIAGDEATDDGDTDADEATDDADAIAGEATDDADADGAAAEADDEIASEPERDDVVVDLFARLRAGTAPVVATDDDATSRREANDSATDESLVDHAPGPVNVPAAADATTDAAPTPAADEVADDHSEAEVTPFAQRDADLTPLIVSSARRVKRVLADEQNEALDALRRNEPVRSLDALLPAVTDHLELYRAALVDELSEAANAGAASMGRTTPLTKTEVANAVNEASAVLDEWITVPLRERLDRCVGDGDGDNASISKSVRAVYREWKTQHIDEQLDDVLRTAHGRGAFSSIETGSPVRWVCDESRQVCVDCNDNTLAGSVAAGDNFPTGHRFAPAHLGCRCLLALADG